MSLTTVFLGRLLGLYLIAIAVAMLASRRRRAGDAGRDGAKWAVDAVLRNGGYGGRLSDRAGA
jgi:hypothetical protein